ncbi:MAG TPA: hypothetical protein VFT34_18495 [Verrucomicrobiae bacterium]|nr:hypothetical protein [Verrucomicrobiae bacterium]
MPDLHLPEDEAARYLLGELPAEERRAFEARLARSVELRSLVRELEEGAVALSMASPRRRPPAEVWTRVEKIMGDEARRKVVVRANWLAWWRSGWAAAAACLVGWMFYAFWVNRHGPAQVSPAPVAATVEAPPGLPFTDSQLDITRNVTPQSPADNNAILQLLQARTQELGALRWQITALTNRMTQLSRALTDQRALLAESSRLKFFQLAPPSPSGASASATTAPISTNLQRALFLAMARELGWLAPTSSPPVSEPGNRQAWQTNFSNTTPTDQVGVDFVDLRPTSNSVAASTGQSQTELEPTGASEPPFQGSASTNAIPGFVSGTNAVLAFDSSVVPTGSALTFWTSTSPAQSQSLGTAVLGNNPMVVTIPFAVTSWSGGNVTVIAATPNGPSNVIGRLSTEGTIVP